MYVKNMYATGVTNPIFAGENVLYLGGFSAGYGCFTLGANFRKDGQFWGHGGGASIDSLDGWMTHVQGWSGDGMARPGDPNCRVPTILEWRKYFVGVEGFKK